MRILRDIICFNLKKIHLTEFHLSGFSELPRVNIYKGQGLSRVLVLILDKFRSNSTLGEMMSRFMVGMPHRSESREIKAADRKKKSVRDSGVGAYYFKIAKSHFRILYALTKCPLWMSHFLFFV